jgi:glycogen operon protein
MIALRREHPVFRRRDFFQGRPLYGGEVKDIHWLQADGTEMTTQAWEQDHAHALAVYLAGDAPGEVDRRGRPVVDDGFLLLFNANHEPEEFRIPFDGSGSSRWQLLLDTGLESGLRPGGEFDGDGTYRLGPRALALLVHLKPRSEPAWPDAGRR